MFLAIDPGRTCGIAVRTEDGEFETRTIAERTDLYKLVVGPWAQVICEDFVTASRIDRHGLYTVRLVGGIQALCIEHEIPYTIQQPTQRHPFIPRARLLLKGRKHVIHEVDALSHLLCYEAHLARSLEPRVSLRERLSAHIDSIQRNADAM